MLAARWQSSLFAAPDSTLALTIDGIFGLAAIAL